MSSDHKPKQCGAGLETKVVNCGISALRLFQAPGMGIMKVIY